MEIDISPKKLKCIQIDNLCHYSHKTNRMTDTNTNDQLMPAVVVSHKNPNKLEKRQIGSLILVIHQLRDQSVISADIHDKLIARLTNGTLLLSDIRDITDRKILFSENYSDPIKNLKKDLKNTDEVLYLLNPKDNIKPNPRPKKIPLAAAADGKVDEKDADDADDEKELEPEVLVPPPVVATAVAKKSKTKPVESTDTTDVGAATATTDKKVDKKKVDKVDKKKVEKVEKEKDMPAAATITEEKSEKKSGKRKSDDSSDAAKPKKAKKDATHDVVNIQP